MLPLSGYDYAESWVQALLEVNPAADYPARHVAHVSQGFIENGGPLSITHGLLVFNLWAGEGK